MYEGVIIEEGLRDSSVLDDVKILKTVVEEVAEEHNTPWLKQWTLHTVSISEEKADEVAKKIQANLDRTSSWYADFKNDDWHYIIYQDKIFRIDRSKKEEYDAATKHGISLGIPAYQVDFLKYVKKWQR